MNLQTNPDGSRKGGNWIYLLLVLGALFCIGAAGPIINKLNDLADVQTARVPDDGDALVYDSVFRRWTNSINLNIGQLVATNIYVSNFYATNFFVTSNYIQNFTNFYATNLYVTNLTVNNTTNYNTFITSNLFTTNLFVENNEYVSNFCATNVYTTNLYATNIYNSNFYTTNIFSTFITNLNTFVTSNLFTTNLYVTNLTVDNTTNLNTFVTSNLFVTNLYSTNIYTSNFYSTNVFTTNLYATNIYTSNFYTTNLISQFITNITLVTSNIFTTNLFATNIYTSNFFTTNLFATNIYTSNFYTTNLISQFITNVTLVTSNLFTTNLYVTNLYASNFYASNFFITNFYTSNLFATNLYTSNFFITNLYTTNLYATNIYSSNFYTTNLFATNIYTTNLYVTNITIGGSFAILYHDFTGSTNIDVGLSTWQGATLSANTAFSLTNSANGINPLIKFTENAAGGWMPTIAGIDQWDTPTNNWATNANAVNYVRILNAGGTVHALLDGTNAPAGTSTTVSINGTNVTIPNITNSATVTWALSGGSNLSAMASGGTVSGTANKVAKFTSSSSVGNSAITDDGSTITSTERYLTFEGLHGTPSYSFSVDPSSGMWMPAIGTVGLAISGIERYDFNNTTFSISGATSTGSILADWQQTWNNGSQDFVGVRINFNDSASHSNSDLMELQLNSTTKFRFQKDGAFTPVSTVEQISVLTWASTTTISVAPSENNYHTLTLGGNSTFATSGKAAGHWFTCIFQGASTNCSLTFPSWHFLNQTAPTSLSANKAASLTVFFVDTTDASAIANWAAEP